VPSIENSLILVYPNGKVKRLTVLEKSTSSQKSRFSFVYFSEEGIEIKREPVVK
jgi:hypothetical protein